MYLLSFVEYFPSFFCRVFRSFCGGRFCLALRVEKQGGNEWRYVGEREGDREGKLLSDIVEYSSKEIKDNTKWSGWKNL